MLNSFIAWYKDHMNSLIEWYKDQLVHYGYKLIVLLMAAESSILPIPSEAVIPFAAHQAHTNPNVKLSIAGIILAGTFGSWLGATMMYWTARIAGRPLLLRYGQYALISPNKIEGAERWTAHYGSVGIFISRLVPVVRHLIGIPAGIVKMDFKLFSLYTVLGSAIWCAILCWLGIRIGQETEYHRIGIWIGAAGIVLCGIYYFFVHRHMKAAPKSNV